MKIAIGADHGGVDLKEVIRQYLESQGYEVQDFGAHSRESTDYPDFARPVAEAVAGGQFDRGILICGTGQGMAMTANKVRGIRAAVCLDTYSARMSREHNNANVLCLGGRVVGPGLAVDIVDIWLQTEFSDAPRHHRRVEKIAEVERDYRR
ncbi:MAG: ribose 5-phosphate isomerase B [Chloroflexi bacterium]|nr:ribose 5-phosphate isomerase B [Chloroflexota bacterium]